MSEYSRNKKSELCLYVFIRKNKEILDSKDHFNEQKAAADAIYLSLIFINMFNYQ
jgi:hypothetical protein